MAISPIPVLVRWWAACDLLTLHLLHPEEQSTMPPPYGVLILLSELMYGGGDFEHPQARSLWATSGRNGNYACARFESASAFSARTRAVAKDRDPRGGSTVSTACASTLQYGYKSTPLTATAAVKTETTRSLVLATQRPVSALKAHQQPLAQENDAAPQPQVTLLGYA
ncbi:hypothetical protein MAPG_09218 [Magnaporthiopsis poae ATCC 64411]|uniref:Uncharacterized protein n=1 Tax=Magnaporthiopsis poae (strain ATCC 64411 / 73-15) TaxID=644358 RepID=A0A0C4E9D6_MAGP6|nr:hypothetical protein MAPG_09218 [Magnaporthiopsis poae ATCC 64411]